MWDEADILQRPCSFVHLPALDMDTRLQVVLLQKTEQDILLKERNVQNPSVSGSWDSKMALKMSSFPFKTFSKF
jgi:hypothetical protein